MLRGEQGLSIEIPSIPNNVPLDLKLAFNMLYDRRVPGYITTTRLKLPSVHTVGESSFGESVRRPLWKFIGLREDGSCKLAPMRIERLYSSLEGGSLFFKQKERSSYLIPRDGS